jgi:hypothetical protein
MPSTYSPLKIQLMATGENNTTWGDVTNQNLGGALEEAIVGSADVTFSSGNVTLTLTDTNASQTARNMRLRCTGTTGGSTRNLVVPSIEKPYIVKNECADNIVVKTAAGTGVTVPTGATMWVYSDGTNVVDVVTHLTALTSYNVVATNVTATNIAGIDITATNVAASGNITVDGNNVAVGFQSIGQQVISTSTALTSDNLGSNILAATAGITITLPTSAPIGKTVTITNISTGDISLSYTGSTGTDGPTTMAPYTSLMLISDGNTPSYWRLTVPFGGFDRTTLYESGYKGIPQNSQTGAYTLALTDQGKQVSNTTGGFVIPANASVAFPVGAAVVLYNNSSSPQNVSITSDTLRQAGTTNTGTRALGAYGVATVMKVGSTTWVISGTGVS